MQLAVESQVTLALSSQSQNPIPINPSNRRNRVSPVNSRTPANRGINRIQANQWGNRPTLTSREILKIHHSPGCRDNRPFPANPLFRASLESPASRRRPVSPEFPANQPYPASHR